MPLRFQPVRGSSAIALVSQQAISYRETTTGWTPVASASYTVLPTDRRLWVTANPCTVTFPLASTITYDVLIKDGAGGALTNNVSIAFSGGETCDGLSTVPINSNYGWTIIGPRYGGGGYAQIG